MPTHVCDTGLNGYVPPAALLLSGNCAVNLILSDIPLISVGILVFGASMFFLTIKRLTIPALCLYFAFLVAFSSAILDLGQVLILETTGLPSLAALQTAHGLVLAREVLLSVSIGFLFLFYWILVAEPSRHESRQAPLIQGGWSEFIILESNGDLHSGTWARWGLVGYILKYILLAAPLIITILQIIWRTDIRYDYYSNVYAADVSLELIAAILLGLKLMINTLGPSSTYREYAAPLFALLIHIGVSVGNLLSFAFIETAPGRFLFGAEIYVLIVHVMSATFHRMPQAELTIEPEKKELYSGSMQLPRQPRSSTFRISPPVVTTPRISTIILNPPPVPDRNPSTEAIRRVARASSARMASWISGRLSGTLSRRAINFDDTAHLWARSDAEEGAVKYSPTNERSASLVSEESIDWRNLVNTVVGGSSPGSPMEQSVAASGRQTVMMSSSPTLELPAWPPPAASPGSRMANGLDVQLPDAADSTESLPMISRPAEAKAQDSPVYSLHGILPHMPPLLPPPPPMHVRSLTSSPSSRSDTSIEELLRQQNELDKSIAALRLFSQHTSLSQTSNLGESDDGNETREGASSPATNRTSDFSLSHFPKPPWAATPTPTLPSPRPVSTIRRSRERRSVLSRFSTSETILQPPRIPAADIPSSPHSQSIPESPIQDNDSLSPNVGRLLRFNSGGTQYDVTSFIGDLMTPGGHGSDFPERPWETHKRSISENPGLLLPPSRSSSLAKLAPAGPRHARLSGLPSSPAKYKLGSSGVAPLKPGLSKLCEVDTIPTENETASAHTRAGSSGSAEPTAATRSQPAISQVPAQTSPKRIPGLRGVVGLPARPTVSRDISAPKPLPQDGKGDLAPHAFERPRPPPLLIRPYPSSNSNDLGYGP